LTTGKSTTARRWFWQDISLLLGTVFRGTIKRTQLKDLVIQYNHCTLDPDSLNVTIDIVDEHGIIILTGKFITNEERRFAFRKKQLERITSKRITIRYREEQTKETERVLGEIRLE
jgi:hypothetical protein